ncbi:MAG: site-2 protease family protein [Candidatus Pacebacteria bacterium]|nr:site-2 protease family protein [Candidatus Paceibacterota bacterium]
MSGINNIFYVIVLIMSVVVHEVAHGFAADALGDKTARYARRLSLNPIRHIDIVGSIILPLLLIVTNAGFVIGWAKPVPYNELNLRNKKYGTLLVAGAGILANICLAVFFGIAIRFSHLLGSAQESFVGIATAIVLVNMLLALFNLIPIPPLDGSKILFSLLRGRAVAFQTVVEYLSLPLLIVFIFFLWPMFQPAIVYIFFLLTGLPMY